ncbi:LOW QUALITY PROTEIN: ribonucleoprotein PTB-binding 2 [Brienomyrus brachyistius]|uniref:LOW QUALITY PROTEIN: ribonucleoprotein PTB-binding 2 n=1 Tax=Brienomyrus brachyistius TaxID=42636 RepID=UPI0020B3BBA0|nr:LOW QUALITY PROTEIN: ribonucleoprotein PTB-binding 2 [Brienomyrus brachyistius]
MAAASSVRPPGSHALKRHNSPFPDSDSPESRQDEEASSEGTGLRALPDLEPDEIERRLEKTRRELSNRRKILIKNLPQDISSQEVHDILREYELKYCYVDRNKGTAFVTLLNGGQAQDAIRSFHQTSIRGREITVLLQPTDSLLCVTNLPHSFSGAQFEELVRGHGNTERCFLVYSEQTGHSKGYGFVEYMKKDSASRARAELLGRTLGERSLVVQWTDVNQLTAELLHSKCLCVDRLPADFSDTEELASVFSERYKPVFCQLAQDEDSHARGFAVVEYESAAQAEAVLMETDRRLVGGREIRVSFCTPGTSGRSTLAALIAAQGAMSSGKKGLLPEPSLAQLLSSLGNPAALQVLLRPYHAGTSKRGGKFGCPQGLPFLRPPLASALLQLGKVQQSAMLGNGLVLQNLLQMQLTQQQLLQIKEKHVPSLLGDPSRMLLQKAMSLRATGPLSLGKGLLGDSPNELPQDASQAPGQAPYLPSRTHLGPSGGEQNGVPAGDKQQGAPASGFLQGVASPIVSALLAGSKSRQGSKAGGLGRTLTSNQTSLLGEPPKDVKVSSNPYLNLASVLPGVVLQAPSSKAQNVQPAGGVYSTVLPSAPQTTPQPAPPYTTETPADYVQQYTQSYSQEAIQQWYQHYQAQGYTGPTQESAPSDYTKEQAQVTAYTQPTSSNSETYYHQGSTTSYGDYSSYMQAVSQYYSQTQMSQTAIQSYQQRDTSKDVDANKAALGGALHAVSNGGTQSAPPTTVVPAYSSMPLVPGYIGPQHMPATSAAPTGGQAPTTTTDWNQYYYNTTRGQKREYPLPAPQDAAGEGGYAGQQSQSQYAEYFKKKRI